MGKKLTYQEVKKRFEDEGCELLDEYYCNSQSKVKYVCNCGNESIIRPHSFFNGHRCQKCGSQKAGKKVKNTFKYVKQYFENCSCKLLETTYIDNKTRMKFICSCGNKSKISFNNLTNGQRCMKCRGREKHTFEYVVQYFKKASCKLLETKYLNNKTKMKFVCNCGNKSEINFRSFRQGTRCKKCNKKNNSNYNPNLTDKDREDRRKSLGYKQWVKDVYKKDNYTCQKCFKIGYKLNAHHIEGFAENKELRKDIDNGITFCKDCHDIFHSIYGRKNITKKQLDDFKSKQGTKKVG
jgi:hypothetical protein